MYTQDNDNHLRLHLRAIMANPHRPWRESTISQFARQIALDATFSIQDDRSTLGPFKKFPKSPSIRPAGSHF